MRALASYVTKGFSQALLVTVGFAVLSLILPPLGLISGAALALVTLRMGGHQGAVVMLAATGFVGGLAYLSLGNLIPGVVFLLGMWLPLWVLAQVLRASRSLPLTNMAAAGLGILAVLVAHLVMGDASAWWDQMLHKVFDPAMEAGAGGGPLADKHAVNEALAAIAQVMTGIMAAGFVINAIMCLYLARGWQAALYNPGGFRQEFHQLRLGRSLGIGVLVLAGVYLLPSKGLSSMAGDMLIVILSLYLIQGVALIHAIVAMRNMHIAWLVGMYVLVFFALPQLMLVLAAVGYVDTWVDFRGRLERRAS
jgi:hypothetical protein